MKIIDNAKMDDLDINNLEEVGSDVTILNNPNLNLKPRSLQTVGGTLTTGPLLSKLAYESVAAASSGRVSGYDDYDTFTHEKSGKTFFLNFSNNHARNFYLPEPKEGLFYNVYFANLDLANPRFDYAPINIIIRDSDSNESFCEIPAFTKINYDASLKQQVKIILIRNKKGRFSINSEGVYPGGGGSFFFPNLVASEDFGPRVFIKCLKLNSMVNPSWIINYNTTTVSDIKFQQYALDYYYNIGKDIKFNFNYIKKLNKDYKKNNVIKIELNDDKDNGEAWFSGLNKLDQYINNFQISVSTNDYSFDPDAASDYIKLLDANFEDTFTKDIKNTNDCIQIKLLKEINNIPIVIEFYNKNTITYDSINVQSKEFFASSIHFTININEEETN